METDRLPRKLVAVLYADVAGYSRLMEQDEDTTHRRLRESMDSLAATIVAHRGRVVHYAGDALLAVFESAVDALASAARAQQGLAARNQSLPEDRQVRFRIGLNLGDVIEDRGDVYGDGVNVAARLESLARPGGICVSGWFRDAVGQGPAFDYEYLGEQQVKNISKPVPAYHARLRPGTVLPEVNAGPAPAAVGRPLSRRGATLAAVLCALLLLALAWWQPWRTPPAPGSAISDERPSIAVMPFQNASGDAAQEYFADGITDDLITDLTGLSGLLVIARDSTFAYKGAATDVRQIAAELKVRYVLNGNVRRAGDRIRVNAHLTDTQSGGETWAGRYDGRTEEVFDFQDRITGSIVDALALKLTTTEQANLGRKDTQSLAAYETFLRGEESFYHYSRARNREARELFERAIDLDPGFARAYAMLAWTHVFDFMNGWSDQPQRSLDDSIALATRAVAMREDLPVAYFVRGLAYREQAEYVRALVEAEKAIEFDPNYANGHVLVATLLYYAGQPEAGLERMRKAMKLNPRHPSNYPFHLGQAYFVLGRHKEAIAAFRQGLSTNPDSERLRVWLAAAYALDGQLDQAKWEAEQVLAENPGFSFERLASAFPFKDRSDLERFLQGMRLAGLSENAGEAGPPPSRAQGEP